RRKGLRPIPRRGGVFAAGALFGLLLWHVAGNVGGDGLFHLARVRKLLAFDDLSLPAIGEFEDASLHPGYAFPLWHGFVALVARLAGADPADAVRYLPAVLAPLAVVVVYEAGWALFRRAWAAGAAVGAQLALVVFAPGDGGAYRFLSLPATAGDQLLAPAALALAFEAVRAPTVPLLAGTAAAGLALAVVHPTYALFLWAPFVGFLLARALWARGDLRAGALVLGSLVLPAALYLLWLLPVVADTASVTPDRRELERAFAQYPGQLDIRSPGSYSLAPEVFTRRGGVAVAILALLPLAALASRRRWAAYVAGGSLAVFALMLAPPLFTWLSDLVSISQARRAAGFLPFAFAFAGCFGVLERLVGPLLPPLALVAGALLTALFPGDFGYVLDEAGPGWIVWVAVVGLVAGLGLGVVRRGRPPLETSAGAAAALFLLPVAAVGVARWAAPDGARPALLTPGLVEAVRGAAAEGTVVYSDPETSYALAAYAPVYVAVAPPGHVANTERNRPWQRAAEARAFLRTGDLAIPERYRAELLVIDRRRTRRAFDLPVLYRDGRFTLYRLPPPR
ncbi:MAG TPA: hypothetical protein VNM66_07335, partial [Thermodesulfobacteriota bacterium]|nr:hypothetical protein [Thermodesulfobacteriota bacterium]